MRLASLTRRSALLAASAIALATVSSTPAVQAQPKNVKIAVIAPLSGPWARQGTLVKFGAETAVAEINAARDNAKPITSTEVPRRTREDVAAQASDVRIPDLAH